MPISQDFGIKVMHISTLSGAWLINDENFYVCMNTKKVEKMELFFIKSYLMIRKDIENRTSSVPQIRFIMWIQINLHQLILAISDYFMLHSMMGEKDKKDLFIFICQS